MGIPAVADYEAVAALIEAAERLGHRYHVGITATAPGFFGAQGRPIPQLPIRYPDLAEDMARQRVMNFEMEASALLVLASLARCRAGVVCAVYANRTTGDFVSGDARTRPRRPVSRPGWKACSSWPTWIDRSAKPGRTAGGRRSGRHTRLTTHR